LPLVSWGQRVGRWLATGMITTEPPKIDLATRSRPAELQTVRVVQPALCFWELSVLDAVFRGHDTFIVVAVLIVIAVWAAVFRSSSQPASRAVVVATWPASIAGVLALTLWTTGESHGPGECVIDADLADSFGSEEGLLNLALFIPTGLLGVMATRRFLPAALVGAALTTTIETLQGAFPNLGRACDTGDLIANSSGVLLGAAAGWALIRRERHQTQPWHFRQRPVPLSVTALAACLGTLWAAAITPRTIATATPVQTASPEQQQALRTALHRAFGT
jgi:hypothetical protein